MNLYLLLSGHKLGRIFSKLGKIKNLDYSQIYFWVCKLIHPSLEQLSHGSTHTVPHRATYLHIVIHMITHPLTYSYTFPRTQRRDSETLRDGMSWEKRLSDGERQRIEKSERIPRLVVHSLLVFPLDHLKVLNGRGLFFDDPEEPHLKSFSASSSWPLCRGL